MGEYSFTITTAIVPPPSPSPRPINVVHVLWLRFSRYQLIKRTCGYPTVVGVYAVSQITAQSSIYPFGKSNFTTLRQKMWGDQYHKLTEILISNFDLCLSMYVWCFLQTCIFLRNIKSLNHVTCAWKFKLMKWDWQSICLFFYVAVAFPVSWNLCFWYIYHSSYYVLSVGKWNDTCKIFYYSQ